MHFTFVHLFNIGRWLGIASLLCVLTVMLTRFVFPSDPFPLTRVMSSDNPVGAFHQHEDEEGQGEARPGPKSAALFSGQLRDQRSECHAARSFRWVCPGPVRTDAGEKDCWFVCERVSFTVSCEQPWKRVHCIFLSVTFIISVYAFITHMWSTSFKHTTHISCDLNVYISKSYDII